MQTNRKQIYHTLLLVVSIFAITYLFLYFQKNSQSLHQAIKINPIILVALLALHFIHFVFLGLTHHLPIKKHNIKLSIKEWLGLCLSGEFLNLILPAKGGTALRMFYLKEKKDLSIRSFLTMGFAVVLSSFSILGVFGFIYCHFYLKSTHIVFSILESIFISLSVTGIMLFWSTDLLTKILKIKRVTTPKFYLSDLKLTSTVTLLYLGMFLIYPLRVFLSFSAIGIHLHASQGIEIALVLLVLSLFQILPGNIGIKELLTAYIASSYGITFEMAILASLIDRAILFVFIFPTGSYFYWDLFLNKPIPKIITNRFRPSTKVQTSP